MLQLRKLEGSRNIQLVEADIPVPESDQVLVEVKRSLISRGTELFNHVVPEKAGLLRGLGYSDSGVVIEAGEQVSGLAVGDRASMLSPHAQYVTGSLKEDGEAFPLPEAMSHEEATFIPLAGGAVAWTQIPPMQPGDTVVVNGQGLVGNLCAQAVRARHPERVITVDALDLRCQISRQCGADEVVNVSDTDSVQAIMDLTDGQGADLVFECVGGADGGEAFEQALRMVRTDGVLHIVGMFQDQPLALDPDLAQNRMVIGGYFRSLSRLDRSRMAVDMIMDGTINVEPLITHSMSWEKAAQIHDMLYEQPDTMLGVILQWDD